MSEIKPWEKEDSPFYGVSPSWKPTMDEPLPRFRCNGLTVVGERCTKMGMPGDTLETAKCFQHGGNRPENKYYREQTLSAARDQLLEYVPHALNKAYTIMQDDEAPHAVQLKAATEILDRAGVRGGVEIDIAVTETIAPSMILQERLKAIRQIEPESELEDLGEVLNDEETAGD